MLWFILGATIGVVTSIAPSLFKKSNKVFLQVTKEEAKEIWLEAGVWINLRPQFKKLGYDAKRVAAEYIANQKGKTMGDI